MAFQYIKSPLNYIGGKYKLLKYIIPLFPFSTCNFVDLFAGGLNVGINVRADTIYVNDQNTYLIDMFSYFRNTDLVNLLNEIKIRIAEYHLTKTNATGYIQFRDNYNKSKNSLDLFILNCFAFNNQLRFNNNLEFNQAFGKNRSEYNQSIENNLMRFVKELQRKNIVFSSVDFTNFDFSLLKPKDFVYCDPPYLISSDFYSNGFKIWTETEEKQLLHLLDSLNERNICFALSNVFYHKGDSNDLLIEWSRKYNVHFINSDYSNCSYHLKNKNAKTAEVLITNFKRQKLVKISN